MALQLKFKPKTLRNPNFTKLFSSKSSNSNNDDNNNNRDKPQSPRLSPFSDIQSRLKQQQQSPPLRPTPNYPPSSLGSLEEIRKNLTDFRRKTSQNEIPPQQSHSQTISFEDLYKRNVLDKKNEETVGTNQSSGNDRFAFDKIRNSLRNMPDRGKNSGMGSFGGGFGKRTLDPYSLDSFKKNLNKVPDDPKSNTASTLIGESKPLPSSVFQKELEEKPEVVEFKTEFVKTYSYEELGEKLKLLRPTASNEGNKSWFSMVELNERLKRLREVEEAGNNPTIGGVNFRDLRETLNNLRQSNDEKNKKPQFQKVDIFSHLGLGKSNIMQGPPKEHLVEKASDS
ncbi:hypothetical protein GIB67_016780 [Kingdonia uniflora]|uniref:Uncharacterized protein n=1 Tax=Kingdonia uniflora TaxID=39325 RepID=A0A7J7LXS5_9MAGN|nr:hypothetical protein GIB67_016780 [Kingdonia uniflora]